MFYKRAVPKNSVLQFVTSFIDVQDLNKTKFNVNETLMWLPKRQINVLHTLNFGDMYTGLYLSSNDGECC